MNNIEMHIKKNKRFKTINCRFSFKNKLSANTYVMLTVLLEMLKRTTNKYQTNRELKLKQLDLYEIDVKTNVNLTSKYIVGNIDFLFIDPKVLKIDYIKDIVLFMQDIILDHNQFKEKDLEIVKNELINETIQDNSYPEEIVKNTLFSLTKENYRISMNLYLDELDKINANNLYQFYQEFLTTEMTIFLVGNIDTKLTKLIKSIPLKNKPFIKENLYNYQIPELTNNKKVIKMDVNQSKLAFLFRYENASVYNNLYLSGVFSLILCNLANSLYMQKIREKLSLVYYVSINHINSFNLLMVSSAYKHGNSKIVYNYLIEGLKDMQEGNFSEELLHNAISYKLLNLKQINDYNPRILNNMYSEIVIGLPSVEERRETIQKVTKEEIINFAKSIIVTDIVYLEGDNDE